MQSPRAVASFKIPQKGHRFEEAVVDSKSYLPLVEWTRSLPYCTEAGLFALFSLSRWFVVPSDSRDARPSIAALQRTIHALLCLAHRSLSFPFPSPSFFPFLVTTFFPPRCGSVDRITRIVPRFSLAHIYR